MNTIDKLYREAVKNIQSAGEHRRNPNWAQSQPFEGVDYHSLEAPNGDLYTVFQNDGANGDWNVEHNTMQGIEDGEVGTMYGRPYFDTIAPEGYPNGFSSQDEAMDWAERQGVPTGGGVHQDTRTDHDKWKSEWGMGAG